KGAHSSGETIERYIKDKHPGMEVNPNTLSTTISAQRKKLLGNGGAREVPSAADLVTVKDLASRQGGVEALTARLSELEALAGEVGGLDRLRACLNYLRQLT